MFDQKQNDQANSEGWRLVTTFNNGDTHPLWDIAVFGPKFKSDRDASLAVINAGRAGSSLHQQAMKLVADSRLRGKKNP
jgi:hypothetical protein